MATKILSVDDSRTIRIIVGRAFKPYDCTILEAANGEEGLGQRGGDASQFGHRDQEREV